MGYNRIMRGLVIVLVLLLDMTMAAKYLVKTGDDDGDDTSYKNYGADTTGGGSAGNDDGNDDLAGMMSADTEGDGGDDDGEGDLAEEKTIGLEGYQPRPSVGGGHLHYEPVQHKHG